MTSTGKSSLAKRAAQLAARRSLSPWRWLTLPPCPRSRKAPYGSSSTRSRSPASTSSSAPRCSALFTRGQQGEKQAIEQLIEERLMLQEAKRRNVDVSDAEVDAGVRQPCARRQADAPISSPRPCARRGSIRRLSRNSCAPTWPGPQIVRARFRATVDVTDQDVAAALTEREVPAERAAADGDRIPASADPLRRAGGSRRRRGSEAAERSECLPRAFQGCDQSLQQAAGTPGIVVKPQVRREAGQLAPALKEALAKLEVGGTTEPERVPEGIQIRRGLREERDRRPDRGRSRGARGDQHRARPAARPALPPRPALRRRHRIPVSGSRGKEAARPHPRRARGNRPRHRHRSLGRAAAPATFLRSSSSATQGVLARRAHALGRDVRTAVTSPDERRRHLSRRPAVSRGRAAGRRDSRGNRRRRHAAVDRIDSRRRRCSSAAARRRRSSPIRSRRKR